MKSAYAVRSYRDLQPLSDFIKEKLISQNMNPEKTPGVIYGTNSGISQDIAKSLEIKDFINKKWQAIINGRIILLDTYDFNPGENIVVELGRSAREAGLLTNYFSLFFVFVPVGTY